MTRESLERKSFLTFTEEETYLGLTDKYPDDPAKRRRALNRFNHRYAIPRSARGGGRVKRADIDKALHTK